MIKCEQCNSEYEFALMDGRVCATTMDVVVNAVVKWTCPNCQRENGYRIFCGATPINPTAPATNTATVTGLNPPGAVWQSPTKFLPDVQ